MMSASLRSSAAAARHSLKNGRPGLFTRISLALSTRRERQALLRLDDAMLRDIGLSREEALAESARPIWDAPANWRS